MFNRIFAYETATEVWSTLTTTYEAIGQVIESNKSIYIHKYEFLKMLPNEGVEDMYIKSTNIINNLKSLGEVSLNEEMV